MVWKLIFNFKIVLNSSAVFVCRYWISVVMHFCALWVFIQNSWTAAAVESLVRKKKTQENQYTTLSCALHSAAWSDNTKEQHNKTFKISLPIPANGSHWLTLKRKMNHKSRFVFFGGKDNKNWAHFLFFSSHCFLFSPFFFSLSTSSEQQGCYRKY